MDAMMKTVPAKVEHEGRWVPTKVGIAEDRFRIEAPVDREIPYRSVVNLEEKRNQIVVAVGGDGEAVYRIASVEKVLTVLKKFIITQASAYRLNAFFMSPAIRGGVLIKDATWEKGAIAVMKTGIWFVSQEKQVCIPLDEVAGIELTSRRSWKDLNVKIDHLVENEVVQVCPLPADDASVSITSSRRQRAAPRL